MERTSRFKPLASLYGCKGQCVSYLVQTPMAGFLTTVLISALWNYIKNVSLNLYFYSFEAIINNS